MVHETLIAQNILSYMTIIWKKKSIKFNLLITVLTSGKMDVPISVFGGVAVML